MPTRPSGTRRLRVRGARLRDRQPTSEAPRCASPQTKTPGASVCQSLNHRRCAATIRPQIEVGQRSGVCSTPSKPIAKSANSQGNLELDRRPGDDGTVPVGVTLTLTSARSIARRRRRRRRRTAAPPPRSDGRRPAACAGTTACAAPSARSATANATRRGPRAAPGCSRVASPRPRPAARCQGGPHRCHRRR